MQGILLLQQQFPKQLFLILSKELDPSDKLKLELEQVIDSLFITIKHFINEINNTKPNNSDNYSKQLLFGQTLDIQNDTWKQHYDDLNNEFLILKACNQQIEFQKQELQQKLIDQRIKYEDLNRQKKEDKDNYRQQYETLKKKAQDKIHRLKDKVILFQTQLQTYAIESEHLRIIAQEDKLNQPSSVKFKLQNILKELNTLRQISNNLLLENSKIIIQAKEQLQLCMIYKDIQGTIIKSNKTTPDTTKIKQYYSQTQSIPNSPDRKLKTEKPSLIRIVNPKRTSVSKNLLAEFDVSTQITKFIKQYYQTDQQLRNSTGFQQKLI
ncbi:unnamed protein product [Paramecium primaurelia]|uniref:Uncharacterized protein n=2 Tax=Paramecium TaxID=5884 RepID=A0A8S1Y6G8_9CILI|nr:unnamed protein product [Paramecium primaurelia]CAD8208883.1 unnamed protein product [Paramecium pentaurelia]